MFVALRQHLLLPGEVPQRAIELLVRVRVWIDQLLNK